MRVREISTQLERGAAGRKRGTRRSEGWAARQAAHQRGGRGTDGTQGRRGQAGLHAANAKQAGGTLEGGLVPHLPLGLHGCGLQRLSRTLASRAAPHSTRGGRGPRCTPDAALDAAPHTGRGGAGLLATDDLGTLGGIHKHQLADVTGQSEGRQMAGQQGMASKQAG